MSAVRYEPSIEQIVDDEQETIGKIRDTFIQLGEKQEKKEGHSMRTSHAKATGLLGGELEIFGDLPPELAQGIAAQPGRYEALVRFAQGPGELIPDRISTHRGMAIKLLDVDGPRIPEAREQTTQDFVLEPGPAFIHSTPKTFLADFKGGVANAPAMPDSVKSAVSNVARATNALFGNSSKILSFLGHPSRHPLAENYFSQAPLRWGDYVAKVAMVVSEETLAAISDEEIDASDDDNAFRHAMEAFFRRNGATFDFSVQLCTDLDKMPVEDASVEWPQEDSPYRLVGRLTLPPQPAFDERRRELFDNGLAFQPNNSLEAHRPLGGVMRARLAVYPVMSERRMAGAKRVEPKSLDEALPAREAAQG
ncbi:catalase [Sphingomonas ginkgonis]|uniref:Catalase n=1 Tax=Sphingomonas ginkgonis TaxID=2315330 RepID=A0A429VCD8_9SPHN|nr:catalase family protein [Sphingomonas ginkgonis]RST31665.1 catalase [Sphingomonas ginkgonis]